MTSCNRCSTTIISCNPGWSDLVHIVSFKWCMVLDISHSSWSLCCAFIGSSDLTKTAKGSSRVVFNYIVLVFILFIIHLSGKDMVQMLIYRFLVHDAFVNIPLFVVFLRYDFPELPFQNKKGSSHTVPFPKKVTLLHITSWFLCVEIRNMTNKKRRKGLIICR